MRVGKKADFREIHNRSKSPCKIIVENKKKRFIYIRKESGILLKWNSQNSQLLNGITRRRSVHSLPQTGQKNVENTCRD